MTHFEAELGPCRLRPFRFEDAASIAHHANDREIWINTRDRFPHPYTLEDAQGWIELVLKTSPATDFAIEVDGLAVGAVGLMLGSDIFRRSAEVGYWLGRAYWGRGIASAAVKALAAHAFATFDLNRLQAGVIDGNPASVRVLEKAGFTFEARLQSAVIKDGRTADSLVYARVIDR